MGPYNDSQVIFKKISTVQQDIIIKRHYITPKVSHEKILEM